MIPKRKIDDIPGSIPGRTRKDRPPFPKELPGKFAVISYDRDLERFMLYVDDERKSSYDLGRNVQVIMARFEQWGHRRVLCETLDLAREFGTAQAIFKDGRTIALFGRDPAAPPLFEAPAESGFAHLPT